MDEKRLRRQLIKLFAVTTALILAAVFASLTLLSVRQARQRDRESFLSLFTAVADQLQTESTLSHSYLRKYEQENGILFRITDAGKPARYNDLDSQERSALFAQAQALALEAGTDINSVQLTTQRSTSPVLEFTYEGRAYLGAVSIIPAGSTLRSLTAVRERSTQGQALRVAAYVLSYFVSVLLLCFVGTRLIDRALKPAVESRARQTEFIAAASHELRSPLAVIAANADTIREMPEETGSAVAAISGECRRMSGLISDMLLLASTDAGSWPVTLAPFAPDTLLLNVYESYQSLLSARGLRLELSLPEEPLPQIEGDQSRLTQVLGILLDNAASYGALSDNKSVELKAYSEKDRLIIEVADHGAGIPDEQKPHIFERFYRGDRSRADKQHFGLGLAIAHELIRLHGGTISVLDTPGGGSTFRIKL